MGPETLLFFSYLLILGSVVAQTVNYCPPQSTFDASLPVVCSSFGTGHIHTWDGTVYDFHEYGDFFLVSGAAGFSVQIRQIDCQSTKTQAVPITTTTDFSATCVQSYVITTTSGTVEFNHNLNNDYLNVTAAGVSQNPAPVGSLGGLTWTITPVYYTNPYKSWQRDSWDFMPDADFAVTLAGAPVSITMNFFSSGYSSISLAANTLTTVSSWAGLCGYADGCAANDLTLAAVSYEPLPYGIDASKFLATSNAGNAGLLPAGRQFVNNTKDPNSWVPYFGGSWRVPMTSSAFAITTGDRYNIRLTKSKYPAPQTGCDWPQNWDIPSFIASACAQDNAAGSDPDGFDQFPAKSVFLAYCNYYCNQGIFPFRNPALQAHQCNGFCEYPKGASDPELHATYNNETFPPYQLQYPTDSLALFTSKLSLGGTYTFNLVTNDSCEYRAYNLTRTITCTNTLSVDKFQATPSTSVARNHWYSFPRVCITATVPSRLVRASWIPVAWPGVAGDKPVLSNPLSFVPCFTPKYPGNHTFELAVYDGCQIKKQNLTIVAECSSCPSASIIGLDNVKEVLWGLDFNSASNGITKSATTTYPTKTFIARSQGQDWPTDAALTYRWTLIGDDDDRDVITNTAGSPVYTVSRYPDVSVSSFAVMYPSGHVLNSTTGPWSTPVPTNTSVNLGGFSLPALKGPVGTTYGVYPPQREFTIVRSFTVEQQVNITTSTAYNVTYVQTAIPPTPRCTLNFGAGQNTSTTTLTTTSAISNTQWNYGSGCVGEYNVQLQVAEAFCKNATDVQKLVVDCGAVPEVYAACDSRVQYNYATRLFPQVTIDASRTLDVYGRGLTLRYTIIAPAGSNAPATLNPPQCATGCPVTNPVFTPDVAGTYLVQIQASTACSSNAVNASVVSWCNGTSQQVNAQWSTVSGAAQFTYNGTPASQQIPLTAAASTTDAPGSFQTYQWSVEYVSSPFVPAPSFNSATSMTPTLTATVPGQYKITLRVSQGCNQSSVNVQNITFVCANVVTAAITQTSPINVPYTNPTGWATVTLDSASTSTPPTTLQNTWRSHDMNTNATNTLGGGATINVVPPTYGAIAGPRTIAVELISGDGCQFGNASVTINYACFPLDINIAAVGPTVNTGTPITLDASTSVIPTAPGTLVTYTWVLVSYPADIQIAVPNIGNAFAPIATITPFWKGTYTVMLILSDGCTSINETVSFTVNCWTPSIGFSATTSPGSLTWNANAFKQVALAANFAAKNASLTYTYRWRVLEAPALSIFYPNWTFTSITTNSTIPTVTPFGNYVITMYNMTLTQTNTTKKNFTILPNSVADSQSIFPSCFFPDLAGTYKLELWAQDRCQQQVDTINVVANCAAAPPTIALQVHEHANFNSSIESGYVNSSGSNAWTVSLSRAAPRRVVLDARGSSSSSNSRLTYYWAWAYPDPRYNTTWAQDQIETPYASTAALLLNRGGDYYLNLVVHDGCGWSILNFTITATCTEPKSTLTTSASTSVDGSQYYTFALSFAKDDNQTLCSSNQWQMINFSTAGVNAASHSMASLPLLFALIASLFALLF